ncbi:MAG: single-stranded-DNA-specific exonuclease RecJ [Chitinophagaceae bacterium]
MQKRWALKTYDESIVDTLQKELKINRTICILLAQRGITTFSEAKKFFRTTEEHLYDPFWMKGMNTAVQLIHDHIQHQNKILIYGDYDVDGTTSVAVVYSFFKNFYEYLSFYIPHRFNEGYGLSYKAIQEAIANDIKLIITLDCGIKSVSLIEEARKHEIDVIVCDHHLPGDLLPDANAILNPKQIDCEYPYKELCGCGIGYKLITAYAQEHAIGAPFVNENIDLVATAIAADIVPIQDENRTLSVLGLAKANHNPSVPLKALKQIGKLEKEFTITDLVFIIAPRVNAAGRMDDAKKAVNLFIEKDENKAKLLAEELHQDNNERKDIDKSTTEEALDQILSNENNAILKSTIVYEPHWHKGVVGIVASRLIDHFYRPTIVLTESNGKISGSARSIKGFNLFDGLNQCADLLETYGGHYYAAGLTLEKKNLDPFKKRFEDIVSNTLESHQLVPEVEIDCEIDFDSVNPKFLALLKQFAPHGPENMRPIFKTQGVFDFNAQSMLVKEKHLKLVLTQNGSTVLNAIAFNMADKLNLIKNNKPFQILYHIEENTWRNQTSIQLKIIDIRQ